MPVVLRMTSYQCMPSKTNFLNDNTTVVKHTHRTHGWKYFHTFQSPAMGYSNTKSMQRPQMDSENVINFESIFTSVPSICHKRNTRMSYLHEYCCSQEGICFSTTSSKSFLAKLGNRAIVTQSLALRTCHNSSEQPSVSVEPCSACCWKPKPHGLPGEPQA